MRPIGLIGLILALALCSCVHGRPQVRRALSVAPVTAPIAKAREQLIESRQSALEAERHIDLAQASADDLADAVPDPLKPKVRDLSDELANSKNLIRTAWDRANTAQDALEASQKAADTLQAQLGSQAAELNAAIQSAQAAEAKVSLWRKRALELYALVGVVVLGVGTFIFRRPLGALLGIPIP